MSVGVSIAALVSVGCRKKKTELIKEISYLVKMNKLVMESQAQSKPIETAGK